MLLMDLQWCSTRPRRCDEKICPEAWQVIFTTFVTAVNADSQEAVNGNVHNVNFSETLLRSRMDLTCNGARPIIRATFEKSTGSGKIVDNEGNEAVDTKSTAVDFSENILRSILPLAKEVEDKDDQGCNGARAWVGSGDKKNAKPAGNRAKQSKTEQKSVKKHKKAGFGCKKVGNLDTTCTSCLMCYNGL